MRCYAAETGKKRVEALDKWKSGPITMVITDLNMRDGCYELARTIRTLELRKGRKRVPNHRLPRPKHWAASPKLALPQAGRLSRQAVELTKLLKKLDQWRPIPEAASRPFRLRQTPGRTRRQAQTLLFRRSFGARCDLRRRHGSPARHPMDFRRANDEDRPAMLDQAMAGKTISPRRTRRPSHHGRQQDDRRDRACRGM